MFSQHSFFLCSEISIFGLMKKQLEQIIEFNKAFNVPVGEKPALLPINRAELRHRLIKEEVKEYAIGIHNRDLINIANELADVLYVTYGAIVEHGLQDKIEEVFNAIHEANMAKLGGKVRADGKIMKPHGWKPADIAKILKLN